MQVNHNLVKEQSPIIQKLSTDGLDLWEQADELGTHHVATSIDTPLREDAFVLSENEKMVLIEQHFREIMQILGLDLRDDSLNGTPRRVAKMFVQEIFAGLDPERRPKMTLFDNQYGYHQILLEKNIELQTTCEHHFLPIMGKAHVAYIPSNNVIGLSKLNRIVQYYAKRPQVQERLTLQIAEDLRKTLKTEDVAVIIDAEHCCVSTRGIQDAGSSTITAQYFGQFEQGTMRAELWKMIKG